MTPAMTLEDRVTNAIYHSSIVGGDSPRTLARGLAKRLIEALAVDSLEIRPSMEPDKTFMPEFMPSPDFEAVVRDAGNCFRYSGGDIYPRMASEIIRRVMRAGYAISKPAVQPAEPKAEPPSSIKALASAIRKISPTLADACLERLEGDQPTDSELAALEAFLKVLR